MKYADIIPSKIFTKNSEYTLQCWKVGTTWECGYWSSSGKIFIGKITKNSFLTYHQKLWVVLKKLYEIGSINKWS